MSDPNDPTGGLINFGGASIRGLITIAGKSYVQSSGGLREATPRRDCGKRAAPGGEGRREGSCEGRGPEA
jgi:hypothetical protein